MTAGSPLDGLLPYQVCYLVHDLEAGLERFGSVWDVGEWRCWTYGPGVLTEQSYRGRPSRFSMRVALTGGQPQLELIAPLAGPSIYHEWLEAHGEGLHHLAVRVPSLQTALDELAAAGHEPLQHGRGFGADGSGAFAYLELPAPGSVLELVEAPLVRREPELVWRAPPR